MAGELAGRVAIVTGGASGIGRATARALAAQGAAVVVVDMDAAGLEDAVSELDGLGARVHGVVADLADVRSVATVVEDAVGELGRVDILVNAAGTSSGAGLLDTTPEVWDRVQAVNLRAPFLLMQHVARHMLRQGDGGRIVNVSSGSAFRALPATPAYGSSKAGLLSLTRMGAGELGPHGINVNAVAPGITTTPMALRALGDQEGDLDRLVSEGPMANLLHRVSSAEDVAAVIVFLCLPASRQVTGQTIHTSAGSIV
jgi:NAD(P)-dependent dehydrogenase (short-subunit alcohol dehydrogenase family)